MAGGDFTKGATYGIADLVIKFVQAAAFVLLGIAGWQLQTGAQANQDRQAALERSERQYLPALEELSLLQLTEIRATEALTHMPTEGLDAERQRHLALQLTYTLDALYLPRDVTRSAQIRPLTRPEALVDVDLITAARMTSSLLLILADVREQCGSSDIVGGTVELQSFNDSLFLRVQQRQFSIDPRSREAWEAWMPDNRAPLAAFCSPNLSGPSRRVSIAAGNAVNQILTAHPDLADRFVALRFQALQAEAALEGRSPAVTR